MPTETGQRILDFVTGYIHDHAQSPTLSEIGRHCGIRSVGTVHRYIGQLLDEGLLRRADESGWRNLTLPELKLTELPLLGRIAAGQPIEAIEDQQHIDLAEALLGQDRFVLLVKGDSMIDAGILDGDSVIIKRQLRAENGEIVCALIDQEEATLKRFYKRSDGMVELKAENSTIPPMIYQARRVTIQGILKASFRRYP